MNNYCPTGRGAECGGANGMGIESWLIFIALVVLCMIVATIYARYSAMGREERRINALSPEEYRFEQYRQAHSTCNAAAPCGKDCFYEKGTIQ